MRDNSPPDATLAIGCIGDLGWWLPETQYDRHRQRPGVLVKFNIDRKLPMRH